MDVKHLFKFQDIMVYFQHSLLYIYYDYIQNHHEQIYKLIIISNINIHNDYQLI